MTNTVPYIEGFNSSTNAYTGGNPYRTTSWGHEAWAKGRADGLSQALNKNLNLKSITVSVKNVYGKRTVYPACEVSRKFADLIGTKTFTDRAIEQIKDLGYIFTVEQETI